MAKPRLAISMMIALVPLFLAISASAESVGFGISNLNLNATLILGETKIFEVARLYNTGDFDLNITSTWISNSSEVAIEVTPNPLCLAPGQSTLVYLKASGTEQGTYSGYVDFSCEAELPENHTSNPTVPGGKANAIFNVVEKPSAPFFPMLAVIASLAVGIIVVILVWVRKHNKDDTRKGRQTRKLILRFSFPKDASSQHLVSRLKKEHNRRSAQKGVTVKLESSVGNNRLARK
jgi:hypothetical protein